MDAELLVMITLMKNPEFADRFKHALTRYDGHKTDKALGKLFGVSSTMICSYRNGQKLPSAPTAISISDQLNVNVDWLILGRGAPDTCDADTGTYMVREPRRTYGNEVKLTQVKSLPLVTLSQVGTLEDSTEIWETACSDNVAFAVKVSGDSMRNPNGTPTLPSGFIALVDPYSEYQNESIVLAVLPDTNGEGTIKQLVRDGGKTFLRPLNPQYQMFEAPEGTEIIGVIPHAESKL